MRDIGSTTNSLSAYADVELSESAVRHLKWAIFTMKMTIWAALAATALASTPALAATITVTGTFSGTFNNSSFNQPATFTGINTQGNSGQQGFDTYLLDSLSIFSGNVNYTFNPTGAPFYFYNGQGISGIADGVNSNVFRFDTATGAFIATDNTTFAVTNASGMNFSGTNGVTFTGGNGIASSISAAVPEPATWAMMILGFGVLGGALRRRQKGVTTVRFA